MKYEMIFGDERLADKFTNENSVFIVCRGHGVYFEFESESAGVNYVANSCSIGDSFYMRRIIKEPKRWTWEDKKAGRLPPIGSKYLAGGDRREFTCLFHSKGNGTVSVVGFNSDDEVSGYQIQYCHPIETPEERAKREREEWCSKALDSAGILSEMKRYELKRLGEYIGSIHDALQSGELPMPGKWSE